MKTQKEIEEKKRDLRYIHQKDALADTVKALREIVELCKGSIDYCKQNNYKVSTTSEKCLAAAQEALAAVDRHKQAFIRDMREKRPAEHLGAFGVMDDE